MMQHPYILEALYQARRHDELAVVEIDGRQYPAAGFGPILPARPAASRFQLRLGALLRRLFAAREPAAAG
jgi:hypothetical protein